MYKLSTKKKLLYLFSYLFTFLLALPFATAAIPGPGEALTTLVKLITDFFGFEWLTGMGENATVAFVRFLIFIFIARLLYFGISMTPVGTDKKTVLIASTFIALLGTIGIPKEIMISIISLYSTIISLFLLGIIFYGLYKLHTRFPTTSTGYIILRIIILFIILILSSFVAYLIASG